MVSDVEQWVAGSSPLARGLRGVIGVQSGEYGIIPARAGFTREVIEITDHLDGSSPLARGLLSQQLKEALGDGIIPARAGFTPDRRQRRLGGRDHPRSRGVYVRRRLWSSGAGGSSPLARGLHVEDS